MAVVSAAGASFLVPGMHVRAVINVGQHLSWAVPRAAVLSELSRWLETTHGIRMLGGLGFENAYAMAMSRKKAEALGVKSIADLARHAGDLTIAKSEVREVLESA